MSYTITSRVEVRSARPPLDCVRCETSTRVRVKGPSTTLSSSLTMESGMKNSSESPGTASHLRSGRCVTMQVRITLELGQAVMEFSSYGRVEVSVAASTPVDIIKQERSANTSNISLPSSPLTNDKDGADSTGEGGPHWVEVMVDVLLGLLSQSSLFWRSVVDQVFRRIVHHVTPGVVDLIANVRWLFEGERKGRMEGVGVQVRERGSEGGKE